MDKSWLGPVYPQKRKDSLRETFKTLTNPYRIKLQSLNFNMISREEMRINLIDIVYFTFNIKDS